MSESELRALRIKRGQIKAQLTRFNNYLNAFDPTKSVFELTKRLENIERLWDEFGDCQSRIELLDETDANPNVKYSNKNIFEKHASKTFAHVSTNKPQCPYCKEFHFIYRCLKFKDLPIAYQVDVKNAIKNTTRCFILTKNNSNDSNINANNSEGTSRTSNVKESKPNTNTQTNNENSTVTMCSANSSITPTFDTVLLSTAVVYIYNNNNEPIKCRALLDSASMSNFITRSLFEKLGLRGNNTNIPIFGINNSMSRSSTRTNAKIQSLHNSYNTVLPFFVLDNISGKIPANTIAISKINVPNNIQLADNEFNKSQHIDLLIGAQVYYDLLCVGQIKTGKNQPIFQKSKLGWLVSGPVALNQTISPQTCLLSTNDVQNQLERFWQIEETGYKPKFLTREEQICEQHFEQNCKRDENGRFTVALP
ncbi:hypothetical protein NQ318_011650, partial [Aromia moschata]